MKWHLENIEVNNLKEWDKNPRNLTKKGLADLKESITKFGIAEPLVVNKDLTICGGHGRKKVLEDLKIEHVDCYLPEEQLDEKQFEELNIRLNKNIAGEWDFDKLANEFEMTDLQNWGFEESDLVGFDVEAGTTKGDDDVPDKKGEVITVKGDLYELGPHKLLCGDSTMIDDVDKLMDKKKELVVIIDPPYGINIVKNNKVGGRNLCSAGDYKEIINDDSTNTAKEAILTLKSKGIEKFVIWGGNYFTDFLEPSSCWIIWDKKGDMNSNNFADCELAWTSFDSPARIITHIWRGMIKQGENDKRLHPTQKPIDLLCKIVEEYTNKEDIIIDTFLGSGSTLIACEKTNRICYGMELDPSYIDITVRRYIDFCKKNNKEWTIKRNGVGMKEFSDKKVSF